MTALIIDAVSGGVGAGAFAVLVGVPRRLLLSTALVGLVAALVFGALRLGGMAGEGAAGIAALAGGLVSESLARIRSQPATVFLLPGLIPLVPGVTIYRAMSDLVRGNGTAGTQAGLQTFVWAGAIALGVGLAAAVFRGIVPRKHR